MTRCTQCERRNYANRESATWTTGDRVMNAKTSMMNLFFGTGQQLNGTPNDGLELFVVLCRPLSDCPPLWGPSPVTTVPRPQTTSGDRTAEPFGQITFIGVINPLNWPLT